MFFFRKHDRKLSESFLKITAWKVIVYLSKTSGRCAAIWTAQLVYMDTERNWVLVHCGNCQCVCVYQLTSSTGCPPTAQMSKQSWAAGTLLDSLRKDKKEKKKSAHVTPGAHNVETLIRFKRLRAAACFWWDRHHGNTDDTGWKVIFRDRTSRCKKTAAVHPYVSHTGSVFTPSDQFVSAEREQGSRLDILHQRPLHDTLSVQQEDDSVGRRALHSRSVTALYSIREEVSPRSLYDRSEIKTSLTLNTFVLLSPFFLLSRRGYYICFQPSSDTLASPRANTKKAWARKSACDVTRPLLCLRTIMGKPSWRHEPIMAIELDWNHFQAAAEEEVEGGGVTHSSNPAHTHTHTHRCHHCHHTHIYIRAGIINGHLHDCNWTEPASASWFDHTRKHLLVCISN